MSECSSGSVSEWVSESVYVPATMQMLSVHNHVFRVRNTRRDFSPPDFYCKVTAMGSKVQKENHFLMGQTARPLNKTKMRVHNPSNSVTTEKQRYTAQSKRKFGKVQYFHTTGKTDKG